MTTLFINITGLILIALIIWWFWLANSSKVEKAKDIVNIAVDAGIYMPAAIRAQRGQSLILRFIRHDASPCAESVIFPDLEISHHLPIDKPYDVTLKIEKAGEYEFTCPMGMYRGKLIVE